jgi:serine/threonine protein kinase
VPSRSLPEGSLVGDYRLHACIGTGSMGEVYEAKHRASGKRVAVKVLRVDAEEAHNAGKRLLEEARAALAIDHPGIVSVTDIGLMGDRPYMVMELLDGLPLSAHLKQRLLPVDEAVAVLDGILDALSAAHRAGVIHRDLKPSNVFLVGGEEGQVARVKLLDFGVARRSGRSEALTSPAVAIGSMGYMAPEQLLGQAVASSDLYAVGCIAFLLLTGKPVFPLKSVPDNARAHFSDPPPKVRALRPEVPAALEAWVLRLLQKQPAQRHASALIALNDLRGLSGRAKRPARDDDDASSSRTEVVTAFVPSQRPTQSIDIDVDEDEKTGVNRELDGPGSTLIEE